MRYRPYPWMGLLTSFRDAGAGGLRRQLLRGGAGSLGVRGVSALLMLAMMVFLARVLGADGYGIYSYVLALVQVLGVPAQLGLQELVIREVAAYREKRKWSLLSGVLRFAFRATLVAGAVVALVVGTIAWTQRMRWSQTELFTLAWGLLLLALIALGNLRGAALRGLKRIVEGLLPESVFQPLTLLLVCSAVWLWAPQSALAPDRVMSYHVLAAAGAFVFGNWMLLRVLPQAVRRAKPRYHTRRWLSSVGPLALIGGLQIINSRATLLILGYFGDASDVGVFRIAADGGLLVVFGLRAVNLAIAPHVATLWAVRDIGRLQLLATASARAAFLLALPAAVILVIFGQPILQTVFGDEFASGHLPLTIIVIGQVLNAACGSVVVILNMSGHERIVMRGLVISAVTNLVLSFTFIRLWSIEGAALANVVTLAIWNVILWQETRRKMGVDSTLLGLGAMAKQGLADGTSHD